MCANGFERRLTRVQFELRDVFYVLLLASLLLGLEGASRHVWQQSRNSWHFQVPGTVLLVLSVRASRQPATRHNASVLFILGVYACALGALAGFLRSFESGGPFIPSYAHRCVTHTASIAAFVSALCAVLLASHFFRAFASYVVTRHVVCSSILLLLDFALLLVLSAVALG